MVRRSAPILVVLLAALLAGAQGVSLRQAQGDPEQGRGVSRRLRTFTVTCQRQEWDTEADTWSFSGNVRLSTEGMSLACQSLSGRIEENQFTYAEAFGQVVLDMTHLDRKKVERKVRATAEKAVLTQPEGRLVLTGKPLIRIERPGTQEWADWRAERFVIQIREGRMVKIGAEEGTLQVARPEEEKPGQ